MNGEMCTFYNEVKGAQMLGLYNVYHLYGYYFINWFSHMHHLTPKVASDVQ